MKIKGKYIGLNQRIPFDVLDSAIHFYLEHGQVDKEYIFQRMLEFTSGVNRAKKASTYVAQILTRQKTLLDKFKKNISHNDYTQLKTDDRKALSLCLVCLTFPITYDLLIALAQGFKVQEQINKKFISEKVMSIYGSNRTVDIAIDALLPMVIELNTIKRVKISIYSLGSKLVVSNKFIAELIIFTDISLSGSKSILLDDVSHKPWYTYFDVNLLSSSGFGHLLTMKDSAVGKGYLKI